MTAAWLRVDLRRRWRSLLVLALLVAVAAATVMTALAGARRGETAVDRLVQRTLPATAVVLPNSAGFDWDPVRRLPSVEALAVWPLGQVEVAGSTGDPDTWVMDEAALRDIERPVVLDGRLPDPDRLDEAVVTAAWPDAQGSGVGDSIDVRLLSPEAVDLYHLEQAEPEVATGPRLDVTIVGVVRSPWFSDAPDGAGGVVLSPAVLAAYPESFYGAQNTARSNALVRLAPGPGATERFAGELAAATGRSDIDVWDLGEVIHARQRDLTAFEAAGLRVFALVAAAAAVVLVGQAVARNTAATVNDLRVLQALGLTPGQALRVAVTGPALAATAGALLAVAGAVVASRWFPIGAAAPAEPDPGFDADSVVLGAGLVLTPALVTLGAVLSAAAALRAADSAAPGRRSVVATAAARAGLPVAAVVGARFALEPGRGRRALPVRPALAGAVFGVLGVIAAFTFSDGVDDVAAHPERLGVVHDLTLYVGLDGQDGEDVLPAARELFTAVAGVDGVRGVNDTRSAVAETGARPLAVLTSDPVGEPLDVVVTEGRRPEAAGEIMLGPDSARQLDAGVGDTIELTGTAGQDGLTVVGVGLMPELSHNRYTDGGLVTAATYDGLFDGFRFHAGFVDLEPGVTLDDIGQELAEAAATVPGGENVAPEPVEPPSPVAELASIRELPVILAAFLAVLALGAVGHALATAVRRRRHEMAVLRAVGMTRPQSRAVVATQASVLALAGLVAGVPLGVALGRVVWRYVAETTPLFYVPPVAATALALVVPAALVAANLLAAWPSHRAASMRVGSVLRAE
ncbi:ABC transporter permease [Jiangella aurantiaca]|uniref:ABC transporter permease n=1 Tax=Jiangella aurantiaca TaxID=2530373 RepID=A0A4R5AH07_9ACTN|nr:ABC transporter permease [Jiangella aurantiaca]TDD71948.1 ABC transporter permease [Jiangella aurantiaca]